MKPPLFLVRDTELTAGADSPRDVAPPHGAHPDLSGRAFGRAVAVESIGKSRVDGSRLWLCRCACGTDLVFSAARLESGDIPASCGCLDRPPVETTRWAPTYAAKGSGGFTEPGYVYFIQGADDGPIKIGFTRGDPGHRLGELQGGSPISLRLLAFTFASLGKEQALHECFSKHRLHGEWFTPAADLLAYIRSIPPVEEVPRTRLRRTYLAPRKGGA